MKKIIFCLMSMFSISLFAEVGPVTIGVCPTCPTAKKNAPVKVKPKQKPKTAKPCPPVKDCPTCQKCEKCEPTVERVEVEKIIHAPSKKNTLSLVVGQDYNGLKWDRKGKDVNFKRDFGWVGGVRYERKLDETWSVSGEVLSNESGNLGVGVSW
jgi:hypothetical protein